MRRGLYLAVAVVFTVTAWTVIAGPPGRGHVKGYIGTGPGGAAVSNILLGDGPHSICFDADANSCIVSDADNQIRIKTNNVNRLNILATSVGLGAALNTFSKLVYSSSQAMDIGTSCTSESGATGDVCAGADLEVQGALQLSFVTADPCATYPEGSLFYNSTGNFMCYCSTGNADLIVSSDAPCF